MKKFVKFSLLLIFYVICGIFGQWAFLRKDYILLIPAVIIGSGAFCLTYILLKETLFGGISYEFKPQEIIIKNKGKILQTIPKSEIKNLKLTYDTVYGDLEYISFKYNGKYYISARDINLKEFEVFIKNLEYDTSKNHWYYILEMFTL